MLLLSSLAMPMALHTVLIWPVLVLFGSSAGGLYTLSVILVGQRFRDDALVRANANIAMLWGLTDDDGDCRAGVCGARLAAWSF